MQWQKLNVSVSKILMNAISSDEITANDRPIIPWDIILLILHMGKCAYRYITVCKYILRWIDNARRELTWINDEIFMGIVSGSKMSVLMQINITMHYEKFSLLRPFMCHKQYRDIYVSEDTWSQFGVCDDWGCQLGKMSQQGKIPIINDVEKYRDVWPALSHLCYAIMNTNMCNDYVSRLNLTDRDFLYMIGIIPMFTKYPCRRLNLDNIISRIEQSRKYILEVYRVVSMFGIELLYKAYPIDSILMHMTVGSPYDTLYPGSPYIDKFYRDNVGLPYLDVRGGLCAFIKSMDIFSEYITAKYGPCVDAGAIEFVICDSNGRLDERFSIDDLTDHGINRRFIIDDTYYEDELELDKTCYNHLHKLMMRGLNISELIHHIVEHDKIDIIAFLYLQARHWDMTPLWNIICGKIEKCRNKKLSQLSFIQKSRRPRSSKLRHFLMHVKALARARYSGYWYLAGDACY